MKYCLTNGKIVLNNQIVNTNIYIENDIIVDISDKIKEGYVLYDCKNHYVCPGMIDVHMHGKGGQDTMYGTIESLETMSKLSLEYGVTSYLPTTMTYDKDETKKVIEFITSHKDEIDGSKIVGIHMEGPFFNQAYKGAQPAKYLLKPTIEDYEYMASPLVKLISIAPEIEGAYSLIEYLVSKGVNVSIGHTGCSYDEANKAIELGANHFTHTYNAMSPLTHRNPGAVAAALDSKDCFCELILDGIHVHPNAAKLLLHSIGLEHLVLITDSMEAAHLEDGTYQLGGQDVYVKGKKATLKDGTIAGSVLDLNTALINAIEYLELPLEKAIQLVTINPAKSIGLEKEIGSIEVGKKGDIILLNEQYKVIHAFVDGNLKF